MIKNPILFIALMLLIQACSSTKENNEKEKAPVTTKVPVISTIQRHARVGMDRTNMIEQRRLAFDRMAVATPSYTNSDGMLIYNKVEMVPVYSGGNVAMDTFLEANLTYPHDSGDNQEGTVFVDFIVDATGAVRNASVIDATFDGEDAAFRKEAIRVVNAMPKWKAGRQEGHTVNVQMSLPITFLLK